MIKTLTYVGNLEVKQSDGNFLTNLEELKEKIITPRGEAYIRLQTKNKKNIGRDYGTWTSAGFEYMKDQLPILRLESRLLDLKTARQAVEENKKEKYFYTETTKEYEESLKQIEKDRDKKPCERSVIVLPTKEKFIIDDKNNWEVLEAVLKDQAKPYFELNGPISIYPVNKNTVDSQNGTLLTQLWFSMLYSKPGLYGDRYLDGGGGARGVFEKAGEADPKFKGF